MKYSVLILIGVVAFGCSSRVHNENTATVKAYVKAVEALDYETMGSLLSDDYRGLGPSAHHEINKTEAIEKWKENAENLYEKIEYTRSEFGGVEIVDGENKGNWVTNWAELNIKYKNGKDEVTVWANSNYKIEKGKIVKSYTFYNEVDVLDQLGYVFINPNNL